MTEPGYRCRWAGRTPITGTPVECRSIRGRRLGPEVEFRAVLLQALPDSEATETEDGENEKLLHSEDPFTFDSGQISDSSNRSHRDEPLGPFEVRPEEATFRDGFLSR